MSLFWWLYMVYMRVRIFLFKTMVTSCNRRPDSVKSVWSIDLLAWGLLQTLVLINIIYRLLLVQRASWFWWSVDKFWKALAHALDSAGLDWGRAARKKVAFSWPKNWVFCWKMVIWSVCGKCGTIQRWFSMPTRLSATICLQKMVRAKTPLCCTEAIVGSLERFHLEYLIEETEGAFPVLACARTSCYHEHYRSQAEPIVLIWQKD